MPSILALLSGQLTLCARHVMHERENPRKEKAARMKYSTAANNRRRANVRCGREAEAEAWFTCIPPLPTYFT